MSDLIKWISNRPWVIVKFSKGGDLNAVSVSVDSRFVSPGEDGIVTRHVASRLVNIDSITDDKLIECLNDLYSESISFTQDK